MGRLVLRPLSRAPGQPLLGGTSGAAQDDTRYTTKTPTSEPSRRGGGSPWWSPRSGSAQAALRLDPPVLSRTSSRNTAASHEVQQNVSPLPSSTGRKIRLPPQSAHCAVTPLSIRTSDWFAMPKTLPDGADSLGSTRRSVANGTAENCFAASAAVVLQIAHVSRGSPGAAATSERAAAPGTTRRDHRDNRPRTCGRTARATPGRRSTRAPSSGRRSRLRDRQPRRPARAVVASTRPGLPFGRARQAALR